MKTMKTWTIEDMLAEGPCARYTPERVLALWDGRERLSLADILRLDIPPADRIWPACRPGALAPDLCAKWLDMVVERAIVRALDVCHSAAFAAWAGGWIEGRDRTWRTAGATMPAAADAGVARAAREAARAAAYVADATAAVWEEGAWEVLREAEAAAARTAARAAAREYATAPAAWVPAAWEAALAAAKHKERSQQVADLLVVLEAARAAEAD